jgi:hypothetical protein
MNATIASEPELDCQMSQRVEQWIRHNSAVGEIVVVLVSHGDLHEYRLDEVKRVDRQRGLIRLVNHGPFNHLGQGSAAPRAST